METPWRETLQSFLVLLCKLETNGSIWNSSSNGENPNFRLDSKLEPDQQTERVTELPNFESQRGLSKSAQTAFQSSECKVWFLSNFGQSSMPTDEEIGRRTLLMSDKTWRFTWKFIRSDSVARVGARDFHCSSAADIISAVTLVTTEFIDVFSFYGTPRT